jgi:quinol monooxygenase YgiN
MILRVFRAFTQDGKQEAFREFFENTALPLVQGQPGCVSVQIGLPRPETPDEFVMIMVWRDIAALKNFVGEEWREAHVHPDQVELLRETILHHYELP